jgi:hypothetical protein
MRLAHRPTLVSKSTNTYIIGDEMRKPKRGTTEFKLMMYHDYWFAIFPNLLSLMSYSSVTHIRPLLSSYSLY